MRYKSLNITRSIVEQWSKDPRIFAGQQVSRATVVCNESSGSDVGESTLIYDDHLFCASFCAKIILCRSIIDGGEQNEAASLGVASFT